MLILYLSYIGDSNDKEFFENLFYSYRKQMLYLALSIVHNQNDAEDIVHDVFLKIAQRYMPVVRKIKNENDMRNYLLKATKNTALNKIRKCKRDNCSLDNISEFSRDNTKVLADEDFLDKICAQSEYKQIIDAIESLDEHYRNSLYYHFVLEIPISQVAKILNQPISTTKMQLVRGKKMLLKLLKSKGV